MSPGDFLRFGKGRARIYAQALEQGNFLKIRSRDFVDWIFLPGEPEELLTALSAPAFDTPRYDYAGFVYSDLPEDLRDKVIRAIHDVRSQAGMAWLTFNKILDTVAGLLARDQYAMKNLVNNMLVIGVLRFDDLEKQGRDPDTGAPYSYKTISLDHQHADVRRALRPG